MGTKVMVRATRSFEAYVDGAWYHVDPDDARVRALIGGGYLAHQEPLVELPNTPIEVLPPDPKFAAKVAGKVRRGKVEPEPGADHPDGAS